MLGPLPNISRERKVKYSLIHREREGEKKGEGERERDMPEKEEEYRRGRGVDRRRRWRIYRYHCLPFLRAKTLVVIFRTLIIFF